MTGAEHFHPPGLLKNSLLQTILASSRVRTLGAGWLERKSRPQVLETDEGVRFQGLYTPQTGRAPKGLVILLHGWEGSARSTYIVTTGARLYRSGYDIFRLNFRDHGESQHLNRGLFFAAHHDEVYDGVVKAAAMAGGRPVFLMGFSLGGSFALRIARKAAARPIPGLRRVLCVSPVLDPEKSTDRADRNPLIRSYFLRKWRRSLQRKQRLYPDLYDFGDMMRIGSIFTMTERMLARFSSYPSIRDYFQLYTLTRDALAGIDVPTTVITSRDDPIIPVSDFYELAPPQALDVRIAPYGGHNGFIENLSLRSLYERFAVSLFDPPTRRLHPA